MIGRCFAVVPAGGLSRRMGQPKLALPLGGRMVLEWVIAALRGGGVETVLVVLGPHVQDLALPAGRAGAAVRVLDSETPDMRATVGAGLRWLEENCHPADTDAWLLAPADHPTLDPGTVRQLLAAPPSPSIIIPTYEGRRGHPTRIGWQHAAAIQQLPEGRGLNAYLRDHGADTVELPVATAEVLRDLDTPADYERLRSEWPP